MKILSIDVGSGDTKLVIYNDGDVKRFKEINAVAKLPANAIIGPDESEDLVKLNNQNYLVGTSALHIKKSSQFNTDSFNDIKMVTPIVIKKYLNMYDGFDFIVFDISLAYMDQASEFATYITSTLQLDASKVVVCPQGISCKLAYEWKGNSVNGSTDSNINSYLGIDIGYNSIDVFQVVKGKLTSDGIDGKEKSGITKIANGLVEFCSSTGDIPVSIAKEAILTKAITFHGKAIPGVAEELERLKAVYVEDLYNFLDTNYKDIIDVSQGLIFFGGGAELLRNQLTSPEFAEKHSYGAGFIQVPEMPEYYNAYGNVYYVLKREKAI